MQYNQALLSSHFASCATLIVIIAECDEVYMIFASNTSHVVVGHCKIPMFPVIIPDHSAIHVAYDTYLQLEVCAMTRED